MKTSLAVVGGTIAFLLFIVVMMFVTSGFGILGKTIDPDNVVYSYEHFFDLKANADTYCDQIAQFEAEHESMISNLPEDRNEWSGEDRNDVRRKETEITGVKAQRYRVVQQYNAESEKANVGIFKDNDLPQELMRECS